VLVFVFYLFQTPPMLFNHAYDAMVAASPAAARYGELEREFSAAVDARRAAARQGDRMAFLSSDARVREVRAEATRVVRGVSGDVRYNDVNYVFPTFVITRLPVGLVGLMIAAIFVAAMSASGGELNALATATVIDFYRRYFVTRASERHYLTASRVAT